MSFFAIAEVVSVDVELVVAVLRDTFPATEGATKSEWQRCCADVAERTFYHGSTKLVEHGYVKAIGSHFRITGQAPR